VTRFAGAVLLGGHDETAREHERKQLSQLIRVGGRLAVLGVEDGRRAMGYWHVVRPGSYDAPLGNSWGPDQEGRNLTHGRALCGRVVVSNGYAADWRPPAGLLCPACSEQI
jgi:hypothetical protein